MHLHSRYNNSHLFCVARKILTQNQELWTILLLNWYTYLLVKALSYMKISCIRPSYCHSVSPKHDTEGLQKVRKSLTMTILLYVTIWLYTSLAGMCAVDPSFKSWQIGSIAGKTFVQIKSIPQGLKKDTMGSDGIPWTNLLKDLQRL